MFALDFLVTTDIVNFGSGAVLDDIFANDGTAMLWVFPDAVPAAGNSTFVRKGITQVVFGPVAAGWQFNIPRATTPCRATALYANIPTFTANKWCCVAATWDTAGAAGVQQLWHGDVATPLSEVAAYATQQAGTGAVTDTSAGDCTIGTNGDATALFDGKASLLALWNRRLTLAEMRPQAAALYAWVSGYFDSPTLASGCVLASAVGRDGTTNCKDITGLGNTGIVTGCRTYGVQVPPPVVLPFGLVTPEWSL